MKKWFLTTLLSIGVIACGGDQNEKNKNTEAGLNDVDYQELVNSFPIFELTDKEKGEIKFMWEEEHLARDVYLTLLDKWGSKPFSNISNSEQTHMDAVKALLKKYQIAYTENRDRGQYEDENLTKLYQKLVAEGLESEKAAFQVGIKIEEMDIADLKTRIESSKEDAVAVYKKLLEASYKHLAAFEKNYQK